MEQRHEFYRNKWVEWTGFDIWSVRYQLKPRDTLLMNPQLPQTKRPNHSQSTEYIAASSAGTIEHQPLPAATANRAYQRLPRCPSLHTQLPTVPSPYQGTHLPGPYFPRSSPLTKRPRAAILSAHPGRHEPDPNTSTKPNPPWRHGPTNRSGLGKVLLLPSSPAPGVQPGTGRQFAPGPVSSPGAGATPGPRATASRFATTAGTRHPRTAATRPRCGAPL